MSSMCRDTIRAASRSITACFGPNCGSSASFTASAPRPAGPTALPMAKPRPGPSKPAGQTGRPAPTYDFLRTEDFIQSDLAWPIWRTVFHAVIIYWRLVFGGTIARFWKAHWRFATFITYPHFLLFNEALFSAGIAFVFDWGLEALGIPAIPRHRGVRGAVCRGARHHAEIHRKPDLSALSAVRHHLDLGVLPPPAAGMGPADRPLRAASRQCRRLQRCRGNRDRRPQLGVVPGRRNSGARAASSTPISGGTDRESCC